MEPIYVKLPQEAKDRNKHGPCILGEFTPETLRVYKSPMPDTFPDIIHNHTM